MISYLRRLFRRPRRVAPLTVLPTLAEFQALSIDQRARVFTGWMRAQPADKAYQFIDLLVCPLAQFGQALVGYPVSAGGRDIYIPGVGSDLQVIPEDWRSNPLVFSYTFGQASKRLERALA